jgi:iron complex outermembrane receptor protein
LSNAITVINPQTTGVQSLCEASAPAFNSPFCALMVRPLPYSNTTAANYPTKVFTEELNAASVRTEGWDFEANYSIDMADIVDDWSGSWTARGLASYQPFVKTVQFPGAPFSRLTAPHTRLTGFLNYTLDKWTFGLEDRWQSGFSLVSGPITSATNNWVSPYVGSQNVVDLNIERDFVDGDIDYNGYLVIQNMFNSQPPLSGSTTNIGLNYPVAPQGRDIMGRYFTIGIRIKE